VSEGLDRRAFLLGAGGLGLALLGAGCGEAAQALSGGSSGAGAPGRIAKGVPKKLEQAIRGHVFERGAPGYTGAARVYNPRFDNELPSAVARPVDGLDVRDAVRWAVAKGVPVRARSGGHSYAGYSTLSGGVVLDLRKLSKISVNKSAGTATVGAGCKLIDVYAGLASHGTTIPAGSCPSVGVSGVTLGGGFGLAGRRFGLSLDNLQGVKIVLADGTLQTVDKHHDPDLFWALRGGGGGNFGIVTQFTFKVHPLPTSAAFFNVTWPWSSAQEAIHAWQMFAPHATSKLTSILHLNSGSQPTITANGQYIGPASDLPGLLGPLLSVPGAHLSSHFDSSYLSLQLLLAGCSGLSVPQCHAAPPSQPRPFNAKSDYVSQAFSSAGLNAMVAAVEAPGSGSLLCDAYGGAINQVSPTATAFIHRQQLFCIQYYGNGATASWIDQAWQKLRPYVSGQAYQNYIDPKLTTWRRAYYGSNLTRLKATRKRVDPHHFFNFPQAIGR
jgi:FAD binding domain/Berberine and berberine like